VVACLPSLCEALVSFPALQERKGRIYLILFYCWGIYISKNMEHENFAQHNVCTDLFTLMVFILV
jgi:hypothetical protein